MLVIAGWEVAVDDAVDSGAVEYAISRHLGKSLRYPDTWWDGEWVVVSALNRHLYIGRVFPVCFSIDAQEWIEFAHRIAQVLGVRWGYSASDSVLRKGKMLLSAPSVFVVDFLRRRAFGKVAHVYGVKVSGWPRESKTEEIPEWAKQTQLLGWVIRNKLSYGNFITRIMGSARKIEQYSDYSVYKYADGVVVDNYQVRIGGRVYAICYFGIPFFGDNTELAAERLALFIEKVGFPSVRISTNTPPGWSIVLRSEIVLSPPALVVQQTVGDPIGIPCPLAPSLATTVLAVMRERIFPSAQ